MLVRLNTALENMFCTVLKIFFGAMILIVLLQVIARNVLQIPLIWTLDLAQLCFSWCIFIGAAVAFRRDAHYHLDLIPPTWVKAGKFVRLLALLGSSIVIYVLLVYGIVFAGIGLTRSSLSLGVSEIWFFIPIPIGAAAMILFLIERIGSLLGLVPNYRELG